MKLSVAILNWNAAEDTHRCLASVRRWNLPGDWPPPTVWVVDNGSLEPGLEEVRDGYPEARFLISRVNRGFGGGNNLGISAAMNAGSHAVLLLNNDASLDGAGVASMADTLSSDPRIAAVGPVLYHGDRAISLGGRDIVRYTVSHIPVVTMPQNTLDVDYVPGTAALIRLSALETVGLLDEDYFFSGEMADLCLRLRRCGLRCVTDPGARACHDLERSSRLRETLHGYYVLRNRFLYVRKHYPRQRGWLSFVWSCRGAYAAAAALARGRPRRALALALGLVDGLSGRFGGQNDRILR